MSSIKYHVNPDTGRTGQCKATVKDCKFAENGTYPPHFETRDEAKTYAEFIAEKQANNSGRLTKAKKNKSKESVETIVEKSSSQTLTLNDDYSYSPAGVESVEGGGYGGNAWKGSKTSNSYTPVKEIAKNVRQDIKNATTGGYLPKGLKYSVSTDTYSGGASLNIVVHGVNDPFYERYEYDPSFNSIRQKPVYNELEKRVQLLTDAYNYDDSNSQIDYFNRNFYGHVKIAEDNDFAFKNAEAERRKFNSYVRDKTPEELSNDPNFEKVENSYFDAVKEYNKASSIKNDSYEAVRKHQRMITKEEFEQIEKDAEQKSETSIENIKQNLNERGRRFRVRSYI